MTRMVGIEDVRRMVDSLFGSLDEVVAEMPCVRDDPEEARRHMRDGLRLLRMTMANRLAGLGATGPVVVPDGVEHRRMAGVHVIEPGRWAARSGPNGVSAVGQFPLLLIRAAWNRGCSFEDLADGFGRGLGTNGGDWSGIRDSSEEAVDAMLERALGYLGIG